MKIKFILPVLVFMGLLGWLYTVLDTGKSLPSMGRAIPKGQMIPDVSFKTVAGDEFSAAQFKGQPTIVFFTASWCPFCRIGYETVEKAMKVCPMRTIGVLYKDARVKPEALASYKEQFDVLLVDNDIRSSLKWGVKGLPTMVVLDATGTVIWLGTGQVSEDTLVSAFKSACHGL